MGSELLRLLPLSLSLLAKSGHSAFGHEDLSKITPGTIETMLLCLKTKPKTFNYLIFSLLSLHLALIIFCFPLHQAQISCISVMSLHICMMHLVFLIQVEQFIFVR